ncbi:MAG: FAD-dependent oxidoreductase [Alphaproteobacteria bacterium]
MLRGTVAPRRVAVVGAGIVGTATACWLARDGHIVTLIDRLPPGEATSFGNAGAVSPGSVEPLGHPGMLWQVPGWLLDPLGPLTVRWRHLPRLVPWLARLLRASSPNRVRRIVAELATYLPHALDAYEPLLAEAGLGHLLRRDGILWVFPTRKAYDASRPGRDLRRRHGVAMEDVPEEAIRQIEPALGPDWRRATLLPDVGRVVDPGGLVKGLAEHLTRRGGRIERKAVVDFEFGPDGPSAVVTDAGTEPFDALVIAAGAWSGTLARRLGSPVPLETERGYHVTIPDPGVMPRRMIMPYGQGFIATPMAMGLRVAGTVELASLDAAPDWRRADVLLAKAKAMFPGLRTDGASRWMGHRPSLPDSKPVIARSPRFANVFYAFGHGHLGLTGGAITGRLIADLVAGRRPSVELGPFRIDRF